MSTNNGKSGAEAIGRKASRDELGLAPEFAQTLQRLPTPNGFAFSAWTAFHLVSWGVGLVGVLHFRGHPLVQFLISMLLGSQLYTLTILQHDCGHRSAYRSPRANLWVGRFLAWFVYMPFTTFTEMHRWHHGFLGDEEKDPDEWFYKGGSVQLFLRECLFMPRFIYLSLTRSLVPGVRRRVWNELIFNTSAYGLLIAALAHLDALDVLVFAFLLPMLWLGVVFNPISRGYEHYPLACMASEDARRKDLRFNTITVVTNRLIGFFWANIIYHVEHHMYPRVPFYRLPMLHKLFACKHYLVEPYPLARLGCYRTGFSGKTGTCPLKVLGSRRFTFAESES